MSSGTFVYDATISSPNRGITHHYYLQLTPKSIWVYNKKTGKVYHKFDDFVR